jgi:hypothetical protein
LSSFLDKGDAGLGRDAGTHQIEDNRLLGRKSSIVAI